FKSSHPPSSPRQLRRPPLCVQRRRDYGRFQPLSSSVGGLLLKDQAASTSTLAASASTPILASLFLVGASFGRAAVTQFRCCGCCRLGKIVSTISISASLVATSQCLVVLLCSQSHGYPYNLDFDYNALSQLQHFSKNNLGDPFIESNYGVHSRQFEVGVLEWFARREVLSDGILYASQESHYYVFKAFPSSRVASTRLHAVNFEGRHCVHREEEIAVAFSLSRQVLVVFFIRIRLLLHQHRLLLYQLRSFPFFFSSVLVLAELPSPNSADMAVANWGSLSPRFPSRRPSLPLASA
ncbi:hypothetical protein HN51_055502, partial [Arachis hypogaea]